MRPSHPHFPCSTPLAAPLLLLALPSQPPPHRPASPRATSGPGNGEYKGMGRSGGRALQPPLFPASPSGFVAFSRLFFGRSGGRKYNFRNKMLTPRIFYHRFVGFPPPVFWSSSAASDGLNAAIEDCFSLGSVSLLFRCAHQFPEAFLLVRGPSGCMLFRRRRCAYVCLNAKHNCGESLSGASLQGQGRRAGPGQGTKRHPNLKVFFEMLPILANDSCLLQENVNVAKQPPLSPPKTTTISPAPLQPPLGTPSLSDPLRDPTPPSRA